MSQLPLLHTDTQRQRAEQEAVGPIAQAVSDGALVVVSTSGGKDSQAMTDYLVQLVRHLGLEAEIGHTFRDGFRLADLDGAKDDGMEGPT